MADVINTRGPQNQWRYPWGVIGPLVDGRAIAASVPGKVSLSPGIAFEVVNSATGERTAAILSSGEALFPGSPVVDALRTWMQTAPDGTVLLATSYGGAFTIGPLTYQPALSPAAVGLYTADGAAILERDPFGVEVEAADYDAWISGGQVMAWVRGSTLQITDDPDHSYLKAEIRGGQLALVRDDDIRICTPLAGFYPALPVGVTRILYSDMYGQSNGAANSSGDVVNGAAFNARFLMFGAGQRSYGNHLGHSQERTRPQAAGYDAVHDFVLGHETLVEAAGETANSGFAHGLLSDTALSSAAAVLTTCSAVGSANLEMLWKEATENTSVANTIGDPWRNLEAKFIRAALFWRLQGFAFEAGPLRHNQGEGNINRSKANHLAGLVQLRDDWQTLAEAWNALPTSGHAGKAPLAVAQTCSGNKYGFVTSEVPWAQLQINLDDPTTALCIGPTYDQAYAGDGVHLLSLGQEMQGARQAVAYNEWLQGNSWRPLCVRKDAGFEPSRSGTTVTLRLWNHFALPLVFDTTTITGLGASQGFAWHDNGDGNAVTVTNAVITNNTTITLTLSAVPTGTGGAIDVAMNGTDGGSAGPTTGNRATLRTNGSTVTTRGGRAVEHFICIDRITVV